jgi:hypothetical protein
MRLGLPRMLCKQRYWPVALCSALFYGHAGTLNGPKSCVNKNTVNYPSISTFVSPLYKEQ